MSNIVNRRRVMRKGEKRFELIYHWEAIDYHYGDLYWIDRIKGLKLEKYNMPEPTEDGMIKVGANDPNYNSYSYFRMDMNKSGFTLGSEWKALVTFKIGTPGNTRIIDIIDFGSVTSASHAFLLGLSGSTMKAEFNAKLDSNGSGPLYGVTLNKIFQPNIIHTLAYGVEKYDDVNNIPYGETAGEKKYAENTLERWKAYFGTERDYGLWNTPIMLVGWCNAAPAYQNNCPIYVKDIKIYKDRL